jgi:superfamily II DNA helicase RecQ
MVANYREISRLWHRYLELEGDGASDGAGASNGIKCPVKRKCTDVDYGSGDRAADPRKRRREIGEGNGEDDDEEEEEWKLRQALQLLLGPAARFRTQEQGDSMRTILKMRPGEVLITVLPTGGGKSILFMLPAIIEGGGANIVVVPFVALIDDLVDRARKSGIDCLKWQTAERVGREERQAVARLIVVSADTADCDEFAMYVDGLRAAGFLSRIFVDECHTIIMDASYRKKLAGLKGIYRYGCPVILLTATLPVRLEPWFRDVMLATYADIIRAGTTKCNIRYRVEAVAPGRTAVEDGVVEAVERADARMTGDQKGVVYCRSRAKCEALAERLGCSYYHSGMEDGQGQRAATLQRWAEGRDGKEGEGEGEGEEQGRGINNNVRSRPTRRRRWIVATTGLGTGIDIKGIVIVVHMEIPYGLVDFIQQTGRGGRRDGEVVESVIVHDGRPAWYSRQAGDVEQLNRQAMEWFVESVDCRRLVLNSFMDGVTEARDCEQMGTEPCDRCLLRRAREAENRLKKHRKEQGRRLRRLREWLEEARGKCTVCFVQGYSRRWEDGYRRKMEHGAEECKTTVMRDYMRWRRRVVFGEFACCWRCGLPQRWCEAAGNEGDDGGDSENGRVKCVYMDAVLPVVMLAQKSGRIGELVRREFDIDATNEQEYIEWIGRSRQWYEGEGTNALAVWDVVIRNFCE